MIIPMKKAFVACLKDDYDKVIKSLQKREVIMIINKESGMGSLSTDLNEAFQQRVTKMILSTKRYAPKKSIFTDYKVIDYDDFTKVSDESISLLKELERIEQECEDLKQKIKEIKNSIDSLNPWLELDLIPSLVIDSKYTKVHVGYVPRRYFASLVSFFDNENFDYKALNPSYEGVPIVVFCYYQDDENLNNVLKENEFSDYVLPKIDIYMKDYICNLNNEIDKLNSEYELKMLEFKKLSERVDELEVLSDQILSQESLNDIRYNTTKETIIIEGWVRSDNLDILDNALEEATDIYELELRDPLPEEKAPTYTKNKEFASQFETITDMFSKPSTSDVDPNPVMSIWYWFIFGMMMGDAGYGLLILIFGWLFLKKVKPVGGTRKLVKVIWYSSIPTIIWGIIFGSYFGFNLKEDFGLSFAWYWFNPMKDPIQLLLVSIVVGVLHLVTGLIVKAIICFKHKAYSEMLSKNISWVLILLGLGGYFVYQPLGIAMIIIGAILILLFSGSGHKSIFGKFAFGLLGFYDVTSYLSDALSYSRIMALAMSSAAVAMVMNELAKMMLNGSIPGYLFATIIFAIGHVFNLVLGLLSAYVHDSRLQYIEFFGKFYEGGGIDFKPLSLKTKYIKEIKNK